MRLIDADELLKKERRYINQAGLRFYAVSPIDIRIAPTVEAEPVRHGHWVWEDTHREELSYGGVGYVPIYRCSQCGRKTESYMRYDEPQEEDADYPNYCQWCGAKMDLSGEDNV